MPKTFKDQTLIEVDRVDSMGDFIPKAVMEKAVQEAQERIDQGTPLLITKKFSDKLNDVQGMVSAIRMEGSTVKIDGIILDTKRGKAVQDLSDVEYAMAGIGVPEIDPETQVRTYRTVTVSSVAAVSVGEKVR